MEEWRDIPNFPGYQASSLGRVRSLKRRKVRILKQSVQRGYSQVGVVSPSGQRVPRVHILIALAFLGPTPAGFYVAHIDKDQANNRADNLEFRRKTELRARGDAKVAHKICELLSTTRMSNAQISLRLGVNKIVVSRIFRGMSYRDIAAQYEFKRPRRNVKLLPTEVDEIKRLLRAGESQASIARKFDVSVSLICRIKSGERWRDEED